MATTIQLKRAVEEVTEALTAPMSYGQLLKTLKDIGNVGKAFQRDFNQLKEEYVANSIIADNSNSIEAKKTVFRRSTSLPTVKQKELSADKATLEKNKELVSNTLDVVYATYARGQSLTQKQDQDQKSDNTVQEQPKRQGPGISQ